MTAKQSQKYKALLYFVREYKVKFLLLLVFSLMVSLLEVCQLAALFPILNRILPNLSQVSVPGVQYFELIIRAIPVSEPIVAAVLIFGIIVIFRFFIVFANDLLAQKCTSDIVYSTKRKIFNKIMNSRYQFFLDNKQGDLFFLCITATERVGGYLSSFVSAVVHFFSVVSIVAFLFYINFSITCTIIALGVFYYLGTRRISVRVSYVGGKKRLELVKEQHTILQEALSGVKYILTYAKRKEFTKRFEDSNDTFRRHLNRDAFWQILLQKLPEPTLLLLTAVSLAVLVSVTQADILGKSINIIGVYFFAIQRIVPAVNKFGTSWFLLLAGMPHLELCQKFLSGPSEKDVDGSEPCKDFNHGIFLKNVELRYSDGKEVLKGVTASFLKGKMTAIVGESGSGKTTIINLLLRLFRTTGGAVMIDQLNINDLKAEDLLQKIGYVGQETFLFHGTVHDNITFYDPKYSQDEIIRAASLANAHEFIQELPDKYATIVGDRGMKLSGGQRQRLAIARALVRQPKILILDEATSNLDTVSEQIVQQTINYIAKDYTIIVVAHKSTAVRDADQIYVMHDGRIVESGKHLDLLNLKGKYFLLNAASPDPLAKV